MKIFKDFAPHQESLELKELGFDEPCFGYYVIDDKQLIIEKWMQHPNQSTWTINAPTFSQAFRFFREKYKLSGLIEIGTQEYSFLIFDEKTDSREVTSSMNGTYEEAELACLIKLIEIVKEKK